MLGTDGKEICRRIAAVASDGVFCAIPTRRSRIACLRGVTVAHLELVGRAPFNFSWRIISYHLRPLRSSLIFCIRNGFSLPQVASRLEPRVRSEIAVTAIESEQKELQYEALGGLKPVDGIVCAMVSFWLSGSFGSLPGCCRFGSLPGASSLRTVFV